MLDAPPTTVLDLREALDRAPASADRRRRSPRVVCHLPIRVEYLDLVDRYARALLIDISRHGGLISPITGLTLDERLRLHRIGAAPIHARVVAFTDRGVHLEFATILTI